MASRTIRAAAGTALALGLLAGVGGSASADTFGETEGCTPGYWKNHTEVWDGVGAGDFGGQPEAYRPNMTLFYAFMTPPQNSAFTGAHPEVYALRNTTMLQALQGGGGSGLTGAAKILFRAATAAYLNSSYEGIEFPFRRNQTATNGNPSLFSLVQSALASGNRQTMLDLAARLDRANNLGCPL